MNIAIIQARTGSTRLPGKILMELGGKPMLLQIVNRVKQSKMIDKVVVATTTDSSDDAVEVLCQNNNIDCSRGSVNDVLDRYYQASKVYNPTNIVRITADCPLIDPKIIDELVSIHINGNYDYVSNTLEETFPDGLDAEVFTFRVLEEAWNTANMASEREHVTPYIKFKGDYYRYSYTREPSLGDKRWTIDTDKDYEYIKHIYDDLYKEDQLFLMDDVLDWIRENDRYESINSGIVRNEGYIKSINNDYRVK